MQQLDEVIATATSKIGYEYFLLPIDGGDPIYRERVYCYELYHQMRLIWPKSSDYSLNGEVDKSGHPTLKAKIGGIKPDLLVHQPGSMEGNYAALEVKPKNPQCEDIKKDLQSLSSLLREAGYRRGIYLIYGSDSESLIARIAEIAAENGVLEPLEVWFHPDAGSAARRVATIKTQR